MRKTLLFTLAVALTVVIAIMNLKMGVPAAVSSLAVLSRRRTVRYAGAVSLGLLLLAALVSPAPLLSNIGPINPP